MYEFFLCIYVGSSTHCSFLSCLNILFWFDGRYNDHWKMTMQKLAYLCALKIYLEEERFATKEEITDILGGN